MAANPKTFYNVLVEFTGSLNKTFPENQGANTAHTMLQMVGQMEDTHGQMVEMWYNLSLPVLEDVKNKNPEPVATAIDNCPNPIIAGINTTGILCNEHVSSETKESMWKFLQTLTALAQMVYPSMQDPSKPVPEIPVQEVTATPPPSPAPVVQAPVVQAPVQQARQAPPAKSNPGEVIKQITSAMPEIFKSLNDLMKQGGDDNPLGQMMQQMMNPNQLQSGLAPNIAANMMQQDAGPAMNQVSAETGYSADDIMKKLQRLEMYEKARAKRNNKRK